MRKGLLAAALVCTLVSGVWADVGKVPELCRQTAECRVRRGLPNVLSKLRAGQEVRIAYLGGSITEANGWRPKTLAWFRKEFPKAKIVEINASISGTGSDYGAIRLSGDALSKKPDLLFVEFRVNGSAGFDYQSVEGIVRQTWTSNPTTDICFVYTLCKSMLNTLALGKQTEFGSAMEHVCERYGIPSIDFAPEIVRRLKDPSAFVFMPTNPEADKGKIVFAKDGVHPGDIGHSIYCDVVARSMSEKIFPVSARPLVHDLGPQMCPAAWLAVATIPAERVLTGPDWTEVTDPRKDPVYGDTFRRTDRMLKGGRFTVKAGTSFKIRWIGNTLGISDIPQATGGERPIVITVSVDGGKPIVWKRARSSEPRIYSRFTYLPEFDWREHEAVFTVREIPVGQRCILGQFLVVGKPVP